MQKKLEQKGFKNFEELNGWHSCLREWEAICLTKALKNNRNTTGI